MSAVGQVEPQHGVARLNGGHVDGQVGLAARVRLHVGVLGAEQLLGPVAGQVFDHVDVLAAAVIAPARITLGVLVRQHAADGLHHGRAGVVLAGDHLQPVLLPLHLGGHGQPDLGIFFQDEVHMTIAPPRGTSSSIRMRYSPARAAERQSTNGRGEHCYNSPHVGPTSTRLKAIPGRAGDRMRREQHLAGDHGRSFGTVGLGRAVSVRRDFVHRRRAFAPEEHSRGATTRKAIVLLRRERDFHCRRAGVVA